MTSPVLTFHFETELVQDALSEVEALFRRLVKRHGDEYRKLERRIEGVLENFKHLDFGDYPLGASRYIITPPREVIEIIEEARRLGLTGTLI